MTPVPFGPRDIFAALSVNVLWGLNFVAMKHALHDFTPFQLGAARYAAAFLPLALFIKPSITEKLAIPVATATNGNR